MLYREVAIVCYEIHLKPLCGRNVELFGVKRSGTYSNRVLCVIMNVSNLLPADTEVSQSESFAVSD
jgi:hypothetical protein